MTDTVLHSPPIASTPKKWKGIHAAFRVSKPSEEQASLHMLSLARTNLGVRLRAIDEASLVLDYQKKIYVTVTEILKAPLKSNSTARSFEWDEIYKAESLIALLYSGEQLRHEIDARLQELATVDQVEVDNLRRDNQALLRQPADGSNLGLDDSIFRVLLLRVLESIHWNAKKKFLAGPLRVQATNRILICLLASFVLLVAPYGLLISDYDTADSPVHKIWSLFALYTALTAGLLGAFSSRLYGIQHQWAHMNLDEVFLQREWPYTLLRAGVGLCGALIAYIFLRSGIAEGALFPKFGAVRIELVTVAGDDAVPAIAMAFAMPSKDLALLTFWCFLAGFSETLVSSILKSTEQELADAATPAQAARK
ncbi:MAG TPA: hypothetical protein VLJ17_11235 [Xanthobacteraceae bacterium]|nr:hypothetical protein [Xanthobacteraceae bacterium]